MIRESEIQGHFMKDPNILPNIKKKMQELYVYYIKYRMENIVKQITKNAMNKQMINIKFKED